MSKIKISLGEVSESRINGKDVPEDQKSRLELTFKKPGENNLVKSCGNCLPLPSLFVMAALV